MNGTRMTQMERIVADKDNDRCRELRRQIQAHRIKRLGWSDRVFHFIMEGLGFGRSLRALDEQRLSELWEIVKGYRKHGKPVEYNYDKQGRYMHALMKRAGWDEATLRAYMVINYKKTHWNLLEYAERRQLIGLLEGLEGDGRDGRGALESSVTNSGAGCDGAGRQDEKKAR